MNLNTLLEEIKIGKEKVKQQNTIQEVYESYDNDIKIYKFSNLVTKSINSLMEDLDTFDADIVPVLRSLKKAQEKIKLFEEKFEQDGSVSEAYKRMRLDSLLEEYNYVCEKLENKKTLRKFDKEKLAHSLAIVNLKINEMAGDKKPKVKTLNEDFNVIFKKEYKSLQEAM